MQPKNTYHHYHLSQNFMKLKFFAILAFLCITLAVSKIAAQPAFTSGDFIHIGYQDTLEASYTIDANLATATGANFSWDYSKVGGGVKSIVIYRTPQHIGSEPYIAAGASIEEWDMSPYDEFELWKMGNDTLYKMHEGAIGNGDERNFDPPYAQFVFPMSFGQTFTSTTVLHSGGVPSYQRIHTASYDGFGSIKTRKGSYSNVFRIAIHDRDSSVILHSIINDYKAFWWIKQGGAVPVFQAYQQASAQTVYNTYASTGSGSKNGIEDKPEESEIQFFPNPAHEIISMTGKMPERIILQNALGITVRTYETSLSNSLNIRGLPSGLYFLSYNENGNLKRIAILKD